MSKVQRVVKTLIEIIFILTCRMCVPWCCSKMSSANPEAALGLATETHTQTLHHQKAAFDILNCCCFVSHLADAINYKSGKSQQQLEDDTGREGAVLFFNPIFYGRYVAGSAQGSL